MWTPPHALAVTSASSCRLRAPLIDKKEKSLRFHMGLQTFVIPLQFPASITLANTERIFVKVAANSHLLHTFSVKAADFVNSIALLGNEEEKKCTKKLPKLESGSLSSVAFFLRS